MPATLTIIRWRDIPAQVTAKDGRRSAKRVLHRRFQVAIDRAAMRAGKRSASDYIGEWVSDRRRCDDDLEAEVAAVAAQLDHDHPRAVLNQLIENGGWRDPAAHLDDHSDGAHANDAPQAAAAPASPAASASSADPPREPE